MSLLSVENLSVTYGNGRNRLQALSSINLSIAPGETVALVGESGSGKSTIAMAIMDMIDRDSVSGAIMFNGENLSAMDADTRRKLRGSRISLVFQDPFTSLNPSIRIGKQIAEGLIAHLGLTKKEAQSRAFEALREVGIADPETVAKSYPHQLSGGMRQRVLIASALVCNPELLILDEPTTALDVTIEAQVLDLIQSISTRRNVGVLFITHNLGVVNKIADRVCVLYAGQLLELGEKSSVLRSPLHPYTRGLLGSIPKLGLRDRHKRLTPIAGRFPNLVDPPVGCIFQERCPFRENRCAERQTVRPVSDRLVKCWKVEAAAAQEWPSPPSPIAEADMPDFTEPLVELVDVTKSFQAPSSGIAWRKAFGAIPVPTILKKRIDVINGISLTVARGEVVGLVGESGSGKSTLGRIMLRLIQANGGKVAFDGVDITAWPETELKPFRRKAQIVFQNPTSSLNPRRTIGNAIGRAFAVASAEGSGRDRRAQVEALMDRVGLPKRYYDRYPHQLSGGEKQRAGIARALASKPQLIVCDEPVSALDVSVQATVLNLFQDLSKELELAYLFISHDLAVISHVADRIAVLYLGNIVEEGLAESVLQPPYHPYTEALLSAATSPEDTKQPTERIALAGDNIRRVAQGCVFQGRCQRQIGSICENVAPPVREPSPGHRIACHHSLDALAAVASRIPSGAATSNRNNLRTFHD